MKANELDAAIEACLESRLIEEEAGCLSALLEESAEARARYWELASIHGLLEQSLQNVSLKAVTSEAPVKVRRSFRWSPIASAAGIVVGIFGATMIWAYSGSASRSEIREEVLFESFEEGEARPLLSRFPDRAGEWFGNLTVGVSPEEGLGAARGEAVAEFRPVPTRRYSYAWHILDLEDLPRLDNELSSQLEVKASFASSPEAVPVLYQIRLAAFAQAPEEVRSIWNREAVLFDTVLQHTSRNFVAKPDREGWKNLRSRIDIPSGTRCLVISLGVAGPEGDLPSGSHYLDAVRARLIQTRE